MNRRILRRIPSLYTKCSVLWGMLSWDVHMAAPGYTLYRYMVLLLNRPFGVRAYAILPIRLGEKIGHLAY
jgi:hypothetical protein